MRMRVLLVLALLSPCLSYSDTISCHFDKFHQVNHELHEMNWYADIVKSLEISIGKTSESTINIDDQKKAAQSNNWVLLDSEGGDSYTTIYAGDLGELLTIQHEPGENKNGLNGWYKAYLISSRKITTHTSLGKCLIN